MPLRCAWWKYRPSYYDLLIMEYVTYIQSHLTKSLGLLLTDLPEYPVSPAIQKLPALHHKALAIISLHRAQKPSEALYPPWLAHGKVHRDDMEDGFVNLGRQFVAVIFKHPLAVFQVA